MYRVLTNSSIPISEKLTLLNEFKGHVKKELVHAASINSYFEALCYGLENYQDTKIDHLCHSSLCYLIKRVAMQAPESYQSSTIDSLIKALLLAYPRDKKLWSGSVKALEAIYLATPQQFETSLESLCHDPTYRTHSLLFIEELIQLNQRNNRNPMEVLNRFIPIFLKILNDQKTVKQDLELIYDIISKYYNESAMEEFIKNLRHNEEAVQIFKKSVRTTVDVERPTAIFDISAELKNILQDKASAPLDSKDYLSFNDAAHAIEQLLPPFQSSKETEHNWRNRQESIIKLRSIVRGNITSSYPKEFVTLCKDLQLIDCISKAALSLRTTLSAHGCQVVKDMTVHLKENLDPLVEQLFVPLRNLLSSTKKIASNNAHTTICTLLSYVSFNHKIFQQCLMLSRDKNVSPRSSSATFLRIYIIRFHQRLESSLVYIDEWLQKGVTDAQNTVRASMRLTFWYYYKTYPSKAKRLLDYLSPQFKRAVEMAKPDHLEINYTVKDNSSRRSSLNAKRLPSYAAPTQASHIQKFAPATRSISEFQDHPAGNVSPNLAQQTAQRRTSAPYSLIRRSINAKKENTVSEVMATTTLDFPTSPHVGLNTQLDLTDEFTNSHSNTLIKKYMETNHEENRVRQSQGELKNMYLHLSSTDLSQKLQGLQFLQNLLVVETPIDSAALLPLLSPVMIKCPNNFKPLLKIPRFHELIPLETLIELFAINQIDVPTLSSGHQTEKIIASTVAVIKRIFPTDPQLSIYYVKYRQIIFNYCFDVISELLSTGFDLTASLFESCATELISVCGNDFDTIKYYGLILTLFTSDKEHFVSILRKAPLSIALKIGQELEKNDSDFHIRSILSREPSQDADVPMDDDRKYMDMTMVNPWNSKQQRASSNGSVIHNQFFEEGEENEEEGEEENEEEVEVNEEEGEEGEEGEELEPGFTKFGGFSKLTEMTKVVSVYQREDLESGRVQGQKEKGGNLKFENNEHNTDNQSESTVDVKMEGVEDFKGDVDLSDIFMGDYRSHTGEHTVKFNEVPKIIDQRILSTLPFNVAKKLIRDPANDSSASSSATADDENVSALIKGERDKSPTVPFPEHESKELSSKIHGIQLRKKELDDLPVVDGVNEIFGVDHISSGIDVLSKVSPGWLLEYELTLIMQTTDVSDFLAKLKKTVSVVKDGPFTIKDLDFIIAVFLLCGNSSEFINWLVDQNGFAEICFINKLLLKSTDDNVQIPANIAYKSLILSTCLIIADSQLDKKFLSNQDLEEFWHYLITLLGNLCGYSNELFIACSEFRDVLIDCIPSYFKNLFENCIKLLSGNEQSPVKITFTLNTISRLLDYIGSTLSLDVLKALTGFIHRLAAEDLTEWREESTRILAKIYDILIARHTPPLYIEQTMEQLSTSQFDMVKAISSYGTK